MQRLEYTHDDFLWTQWTAENITKAASDCLIKKQQQLEKIIAITPKERTFANTPFALDTADMDASEVSAKIELHLMASPIEEVREAAKKAITQLDKKLIDLDHDERLYTALKEYKKYGARKEALANDQKRLLERQLRDFKRMGFELPNDKQKRFKKNVQKIAELCMQSESNVNEDQSVILCTEKELVGLPKSYIENLRKDKHGNFIVSLDYAEFVTFIENAQNAQKRKELIDKSSRRGGKKNVKILEKLVSLRKENAKLLGYTNHVEFKTIERMAKNSKNVQEFLLGLLSRTSRLCKEELRNLKNYKREKLSNPHAELTYYDIAYLRKQQKKEQFGVDEELLRQFFPQAKVVKEMFALFEKIFEIKIEEAPDFPVWHDEVRLYKISDRDGVCGYFFFDLYPRKNKYAHAAGVMHIAFSRSHSSVTIEHFLPPVEVLLANFARPNKKGDALMSHGEIVALFHEFGHILHNLLNKTVIGSQAGTLVARDFVETPSQMFENWAWNENVLKKLSSHYLTRESLTKKQCQKIIESDRYGRGYFYTKQLTLALFDYDINAKKIYNFVDHYHKLVKRYLSISMPKQYLFVPGFMHIYRGYDSGYYVYMWSLVYAQDMFERFKKEGVMNKKVGKDFRTWILEPGSSEDEMKLVKGFLGRKPNNKAFLREMGV